MPRFYNDCMRPSSNKAAKPVEEKKGKGKKDPPTNGAGKPSQESGEGKDKKDEGGGK